MKVARFVAWYSQALGWVGSALLIVVLMLDRRWFGQIPEIVVLFGSAIALRGLYVPLSKYSYLNQTALVGLAGSVLVGVPATALAVAGATLITDSLWQRKPLRVGWINLGREVLTIVAAFGVYSAALNVLDMPDGAPVLNIDLLPALVAYALAYFLFGRILFYFSLIIRSKLEPAERMMIIRYEVITYAATLLAATILVAVVIAWSLGGWLLIGVLLTFLGLLLSLKLSLSPASAFETNLSEEAVREV